MFFKNCFFSYNNCICFNLFITIISSTCVMIYCNIILFKNHYYNIYLEVKTQKLLNTLSIFQPQYNRFIECKLVTNLFLILFSFYSLFCFNVIFFPPDIFLTFIHSYTFLTFFLYFF